MAFCGLMIGLGFVLSSQVSEIRNYTYYAVVEAIGLSGTFGIATAVTSRWFTGTGAGFGNCFLGFRIGTLLIVPASERLIHATDWSTAFPITELLPARSCFYSLSSEAAPRENNQEPLTNNQENIKSQTTISQKSKVKASSPLHHNDPFISPAIGEKGRTCVSDWSNRSQNGQVASPECDNAGGASPS
jgi:hypothetical protein